MKNLFPLSAICIPSICVLLLTACGDKSRLRFTNTLPDEFAIIALQPLTLPADYNLLPPTAQSETEFSGERLQENIRASLLLNSQARSPLVSNDRAFLFAARADLREVNIRRLLEQDNLQAISEPLNVAEAIALEEPLDGNVRTFFIIKNKGARTKAIE